jgi:hypothetical protein
MHTTNRIRRALRALDVFTLVTLNPPTLQTVPATSRVIRQHSGSRVF